MQWRKWRLIASLWRLELDTKSGPLETGDFGQNRQRAGNNGENPPSPLETGNFGENGDCSEIGDFVENRHRAGGIQSVANIQIGCQKWPPQIR